MNYAMMVNLEENLLNSLELDAYSIGNQSKINWRGIYNLD